MLNAAKWCRHVGGGATQLQETLMQQVNLAREYSQLANPSQVAPVTSVSLG